MKVLRSAVAVTMFLGVAACSGPQTPSGTSPAPTSQERTTTSSRSSQTQPAADSAGYPCGELSDADVSAHLGGPVRHERADQRDVGKGCRWEMTGTDSYILLQLHNPPFPGEKDAKRMTKIGGAVAAIQVDDGGRCLVNLDGGDSWLKFTSQSGRPQECDRVMPLLEKLVVALMW